MKISKYIADIKVDEKRSMLYSTLSRQYYVYLNEEKNKLTEFLKDINKGQYTKEEMLLFKELLDKKIIISKNYDEYYELRYQENMAKHSENIFRVVLYATNACNFRCTYCEQTHEVKQIDEVTAKKFLKLVERKAKECKRIEINWFGGEPFVEFFHIEEIMDKCNEICEKENCEIVASAITNGYLLTSDKIERLIKLNFKWLQITIDGQKEIHDKQRVLSNGNGTYEVVVKNMLEVLKAGIRVTLRININDKNCVDISVLLDSIPKKYRSKVQISIVNVFQNEHEISTFTYVKQAIDKGYPYRRDNRYRSCHATLHNAVIMDTDGSLLLCSNTKKGEKRLGFIDDEGKICIERKHNYYKIHEISILDNEVCKSCLELPFCIAGCKYVRLEDENLCIKKRGDGLSIEEHALLDYYYDLKREKRNGTKSRI